jgi:glycopeptide antibiotics resistance protein
VLSANGLVVAVGVAIIVVVVIGKAHGTATRTIVARCGLVIAVAWILALTIFPIPIEVRTWRSHRQFSNMSFIPFRTIGGRLAHGLERSEARQLFGNIALFTPIGFLLPFTLRSLRRVWPTLLVAAGLSVLVETSQALLPGHSTDVDDVVLNTAGAALGFLAFSVIMRMGRQRTARDRRTAPMPTPTSVG